MSQNQKENQNQKSNRKLQKALRLVDLFYDFIANNQPSDPSAKALLMFATMMLPKRENMKNKLMKSFNEEDMDKLMAKLKEIVDDYYAEHTQKSTNNYKKNKSSGELTEEI